jgi:FKBP-type peptidyl-prolyl cis-trans isomerase
MYNQLLIPSVPCIPFGECIRTSLEGEKIKERKSAKAGSPAMAMLRRDNGRCVGSFQRERRSDQEKINSPVTALPQICRPTACMGQYTPMSKSLPLTIQLLATGAILLGHGLAQQTPAATTSQSPSGQTSSSPAKKPAASSTTAKKSATAAKSATASLTLKTDKEKQSYAMGMNLGLGLHHQGLTLDPALVARGMKDAMTGGKTALTEDEARAALTQLRGDVQQKMEAKNKEESATNRKEGEAFLASNKTKEGVQSLPDGLEYKILKAGNGPKPTASDSVTCNYRGTLLSGREFDSSYKRGQPATFPLGGVIKGWTEALQLMPVGSKWELYIPADLAYGDHPPGADIPPGSTLIFEVELLSIGEQKK